MIPKIKLYEAWITLNDTDSIFKGILYEINDLSILISSSEYGALSEVPSLVLAREEELD